MFTKQHYAIVAGIIREGYKDAQKAGYPNPRNVGYRRGVSIALATDRTMERFIEAFKADNENFNESIFRGACDPGDFPG